MSDDDRVFKDGGGQSTSYFSGRKKQLNRSESAVEPMGIPMVKEMIQNADDRKAEQIFFVFTDESLWITNDGETFNFNEKSDDDGVRTAGDLANLLGVEEGLAGAEEDRVGRHGTGFELIYCVGNRFEIHWWDRTFSGAASMRSNPDLLESGASVTWDYLGEHDDFDALECPFDIEERQKDRRGVLFKADWRTEKEAEKEYGEHGPIFKNAAFPQWDKTERRSFFDSCKAYAPFMIQFCKSITEMTVIWLRKDESEFFRASRSHAYPTVEYTGNSAGEFDHEEVEIHIGSGKCEDKSALRGFFGVKEEIQKLWSEKTSSFDYRIRLLHGWTVVHGTSGVGNNMEMDPDEDLTSWKLPQYDQFHTHSEFDCPHCPMKRQDGWIPDRTSVVHIHMPLDSIDEELGRLEKPGQTLLHSILPLGVVSLNRFMVSADLYVNEGRAQLEFQGDKGVWNSCSALTAFWLHSEMLSWLVHNIELAEISITDEPERAESAIMQALPADTKKWFTSLNLSDDGFPDGADLIGEGWRSELYFDLSEEPWVLDTQGGFCSPPNILIPTDEEDEYDDDIRVVLERLGMSVMRRETHNHILSIGSYVLDNLRNLLRKCRVYDPGLGGAGSQILEEVEGADLDGLSIECKIALARLVVHLNSNFLGAVYPDENGKLRARAEFSTIPEGLSVLQELQGESPVLHPDIGDLFEPGVTTVQDALSIIQRMQESEPERFERLDKDSVLLDVLTRMADQILSDPGITDKNKILYDFIPCRFGERVFLRAYQHLVECPHDKCEGWNNPPLIDHTSKCVECEGTLLRKDVVQRIVLPTTRREDWSRMHIMSPHEQDIPSEISQRMVIACSLTHFSDKLADTESKVGLMRYLGKKGRGANAAKQESLFHEEALMAWLKLDGLEHNQGDVENCRQAFLGELRRYASKGGRTNLRGLFNDAPLFYGQNRNWSPASDFILYIDNVTLKMLQKGNDAKQTPHPELLHANQELNQWMTWNELGGAKMNVEFEHLEQAIKGLLGGDLDSYVTGDDEKCRNLAVIATHMLKHQSLLEGKSEDFDHLKWIPIGLQDGFESESDMLCRWSEFPLPGPEFDSVWGLEAENPHITFDGASASPHQFFDEDDLAWMRECQKADQSWASSVGMTVVPSAERMFQALVSNSQSPDDPLGDGFYELLQGLEEIPEPYTGSVCRFYHSGSGEWHEDVGEATLLVDKESDKDMIGGNCIQKDGLSVSAENLLEMVIGCKPISTGSGSSEGISRLSVRWEELSPRQILDATSLLKALWKTFHDSDTGLEQVDCRREGASVMFPLDNSAVMVDSIVICPEISGLQHFVGQSGVFTITDLAQRDDEDLELHRSPLSIALSKNGALDWKQMGDEDPSEEILIRINQLRDDLGLGGEMVEEGDGFAWADSMLEMDWWYSKRMGRTVLPIPYWREGELVVDIARGDEVYFAPTSSVHEDRVDDFRERGLKLLHLGPSNEDVIIELEGRVDKEGPFPGFDENLTQENIGLGSTDKDAFPALADYMGDLLTAIRHKFEHDIEGDDPLLFLGELIEGYRTNKLLQMKWVVGDVEVIKGQKHWTIESSRPESPVWPQMEITYRTETPERYREMIVKSILRKGLKMRIDRDSEAAMDERERIGRALDREKVRSGDIVEIVSGLLVHTNPRRWGEVPGFEGIWAEREPRLTTDLILNPDVQAAREKILAWYNDTGCQICGQLTPDGPGSDSHEETRAQIFKSKQTKYIWHSATALGGNVGNWLYLCPTHFRSLSKKCLHLSILIGDEEVELDELVERAREDRGVLSNITAPRIYADVYERRGESEYAPWEEDENSGAVWSGNREILRMQSEHAKKIADKIKTYVLHKLA